MDRIKLDHANKILSQVGRQFGVEGLEIKREGVCAIRIDGKFDIYIEASDDTDQLLLLGEVRNTSSISSNDVYKNLLIRNMWGSGGNFFAINQETENVLLCTYIDMDNLDFDYFVSRLERFINYLDTTLQSMSNPDSAFSSKTAPERQPSASPSSSSPRPIASNSSQSKLLAQLSR